jgi:polar amino acid transport system substrate-binding protein
MRNFNLPGFADIAKGRLRRLLSGIALALASLPVSAQSIDDLVFITEDYPPFNFERDGRRLGIAVDVLEEMLIEAGSKKTRADIRVWPWARGYETALKEKNTVLFSTARTDAREHLFKWVGPIMPSRIVLVAKKERAIHIKSADDLRQSAYKIGVVREDIGGQLLANLGVHKDRTVQANSGISVAKMLQADRVDMWAYGAPVIMWNLKELGYPADAYKEVFTLTESQHYYYAINKDTDDRLVEKLQSALEQVKAKGRFNAIIARYR